MSAPVAVGAPSFMIFSGANSYALCSGAVFKSGPFGGTLEPAPEGGYGEVRVIADPDDPTQLALENRTSGTWAVRMPDGTSRGIAPDGHLRLADGLHIEVSKAHTMCVDTFGAGGGFSYPVAAVECRIICKGHPAAGGDAVAADNSPSSAAFRQTVEPGRNAQAPAFGQPQAPQWQPPAQAVAWPPPPAATGAGAWDMNAGAAAASDESAVPPRPQETPWKRKGAGAGRRWKVTLTLLVVRIVTYVLSRHPAHH